jgi:hypothetical protein
MCPLEIQIDLANKAKIVKCGHHIALKACEITGIYCGTGKSTGYATLNDAAKLNNDLKVQQLKRQTGL